MKLGEITWSCDRCGAQKTTDAKNDHIPVAWHAINVGLNREMCPACMKSFLAWWYSRESVSC